MRIAGIKYRINPSFFVAMVVFAFDRLQEPVLLLEWTAVVLVSITAHELGHALIARSFGLEPSIELHMMGGTTSWQSARPLAAWRHIAISLAGPFAGFAFGALVFAAALVPAFPAESRFAQIAYGDLLWVNFGWGALNLLPVLPLDGGHVAQRLTGLRAAQVISIVTAGGLALAAYLWHFEPAAFLLVLLAVMNFGQRKGARAPRRFEAGWKALEAHDVAAAERTAREALASLPAADTAGRREAAALLVSSLAGAERFDDAVRALDEFPVEAPADPWLRGIVLLHAQRPAEAIEPLRAVFESRRASDTGAWLARALAAAGRLDEAKAFATTEAATLDGTGFVVVEGALFHAGRFDDALAISTLAFQRNGKPVHAYNAACSAARAGRSDEAIGWLDRAATAGWSDVAALDADEDLASLRLHPRYDGIRSRIATAAEFMAAMPRGTAG